MSTSIGFDIYARDRASKSLDKIGHSAQRSGGMFKAMGAAAKFASKGLAVAFVAAGAAAFKMAKGAMADQAAASILAKQLHNSADATKAQVSATEDWITKQGIAFGVADDDLRPALGRLVAVTHDVGKAQRLASLGMDIAAGTGKNLASVTAALAKAQTGSLGGLSKLGVATKDAEGNTLSLKQVTEQMAKTYSGQASKAAETTAGKFARLKLALSETGESIGYKLLPVLTTMATWFLSRGLPALSNFSSMVQRKLGPAIRDLAVWFRSDGIPAIMRFGAVLRGDVLPAVVAAGQAVLRTVQFFNQHRTAAISLATAIGVVVAITKIHAAVMAVQAAGGLVAMIKGLRIVTSVTRAYAAVQWALNAALTANPIGIVVMGLVALGVGLAVAYRKSDTFRRIVNAAFASVKNVVGSVVRWLGKYVPAVFGFVVGAVKGYVNVYRAVVVGAFNAVRAVVSGVMNAVKAVTNASWGGIVRATQQGVGKVVSFVRSLPGKMLGALGNLGHLLWNAGSSVIDGLIDGIMSKYNDLKAKLKAITDIIPDWKGPLDKDKVLLQPAGAAIMAGLIKGIRSGEEPLKKVLDAITNNVQRTGDKLKGLMSARSEFAAGFQGFATSIFGADTGDGAAPTVDSILTYAATQRDQAAQVQTDVRRLMRMGLSKSLIRQMQESGSSGIAQMHALAGGNSQQIALLNSLNAQTSRDLAGAGSSAAGAMFNSDIREAQRDKRLADAIAQAIHRLAAGDKGEIHIHLEGRTLVESIRKHQRNKGEKPTV